MKLVILGELTDMNTYVNAERSNRFAGAKIKARETERVAWECRIQKFQPVTRHATVAIAWYCKNQRKDPDNIAFAKKFILDGLKKAGVITNDGWKNIVGFTDIFIEDKENPRIEIELI